MPPRRLVKAVPPRQRAPLRAASPICGLLSARLACKPQPIPLELLQAQSGQAGADGADARPHWLRHHAILASAPRSSPGRRLPRAIHSLLSGRNQGGNSKAPSKRLVRAASDNGMCAGGSVPSAKCIVTAGPGRLPARLLPARNCNDTKAIATTRLCRQHDSSGHMSTAAAGDDACEVLPEQTLLPNRRFRQTSAVAEPAPFPNRGCGRSSRRSVTCPAPSPAQAA